MEEIKPFLEHVKGNTYCIVTGYSRIPLYRLDEERAVLIDSGLPKYLEDIVALLEEQRIRPVAILTSHAHPDHIGNHIALRQRFGAQIYVTAYYAATCSKPMNAYTAVTSRMGFRSLKTNTYRFFSPDHVFDWDAPSVTVEGAQFRLLQLPGHDAEHLGFITPDNVAYLGDTVLSPEIIQALRLPFCVCVELDLESKEKVASLKCDRYILAHNAVYDSVEEVVRANLETVHQRLDDLESLADKPIGMDDLVRAYLILTKAELDSPRKVKGIHYNAFGYVGYLVDVGRLLLKTEDGLIKYANRKYDAQNRPEKVSGEGV